MRRENSKASEYHSDVWSLAATAHRAGSPGLDQNRWWRKMLNGNDSAGADDKLRKQSECPYKENVSFLGKDSCPKE